MRRDYLLLVVGWLRRWELCVGDGRLTAPVPPRVARLRARSGARRNMWNLIDPYPLPGRANDLGQLPDSVRPRGLRSQGVSHAAVVILHCSAFQFIGVG
jgi:hypothetical protein